MTPLTWTLSVVAPIVGVILGRLSKRTPAPEPVAEDPRLVFERQRADKAEERVTAQVTELRDWAGSHKALEAQVAELKDQLAAASAQPATSDEEVSALEAEVRRLEGMIEAGAGSVSREDVVERASLEERLAVLTAELNRANQKIAELERRLDRE